MMVCSLAFSQSKKEKKRLKEEKAQNEFVELKKTIESGKMKFQFDWAMTQKGRRVNYPALDIVWRLIPRTCREQQIYLILEPSRYLIYQEMEVLNFQAQLLTTR